MKRFVAAMLLICCFAAAGEVLIDPGTRKPVRYAGRFSAKQVNLPNAAYRRHAMRGVWVATVENIDFARHSSAAAFKADYRKIVRNLKNAGFNAIFFQVRPHCDAFYASNLNPWSSCLAGADGRGIPGFDPLPFMIAEAHRNGLQFHAWLNPYRVNGNTRLGKAAYLNTLSPKNFARCNPGLVLAHRKQNGCYSLFLNPGEPAVRQHIASTVNEIIRKYPVDGIHFDDYFYLYEDIGNIDRRSYLRNNPRRLSPANWRRANVTATMQAVHNTIKTYERQSRRKVSFGISPFGIWANRSSLAAGSLTGGKQSFFTQFADTRGWVKAGLVDYIAPQLYWQFSHNTAAYAALADWWASTVRGTGVKLYIGMGFYRTGAAGWSDREIINQMRYNQLRREIEGEIFFSYRHLFAPDNRAKRSAFQKLQQLWR